MFQLHMMQPNMNYNLQILDAEAAFFSTKMTAACGTANWGQDLFCEVCGE